MDFTYTPEQEKFRAEIAGWLEKNSAEAFGSKGEGLGGSTASLLDVRDDGRWAQLLDYHRRLYKAGYVALHWPKEWGGGGASMIEQAIYQDEVLRLGLPLYGANQLAIDRIGPTIMHLGTEQQKNATCSRCSPARKSGARVTPNPARAPTWQACRRAR